MSAKLNISESFVSQEDLSRFDSLIPNNISQLNIHTIEVAAKYGDSVEMSLVVNVPKLVGRRYLSLLTSKKEIVESLNGVKFEDLPREDKNNYIEMILKNNKQYLKEAIFNN